MDEIKAKQIIGSENIREDGYINQLGNQYCSWSPKYDPQLITLDGQYTQEQLEAIMWWMKNKR